LHEFTDALHAYSQSLGDLSVSKAFCPQQYALALFWREQRKCVFEVPHSLVQKKLLFRTRPRINTFPNRRPGFLVVRTEGPQLRAVDIHREIVSNTEDPGTKIVFCVALKVMADQAEKRILDDVFCLIRTHAQAVEIGSQGWSQLIVQINDPLASLGAPGWFGNKDRKIRRNQPVSFRGRARPRSATFLKDSSGHLPSEKEIAEFRRNKPAIQRTGPKFFKGQ
jgi:hypothetical protein